MPSTNSYSEAAGILLRENRVTVRRFRSNTTGGANSKTREIETPEARGPISFGTLAHEVGHVALNHSANGKVPRYVEEVEAWEFALRQMERFGLRGYERVYVDAAECVAYAFSKAIRRGVSAETIRDRFPGWWSDALAHDRLNGWGSASVRFPV